MGDLVVLQIQRFQRVQIFEHHRWQYFDQVLLEIEKRNGVPVSGESVLRERANVIGL